MTATFDSDTFIPPATFDLSLFAWVASTRTLITNKTALRKAGHETDLPAQFAVRSHHTGAVTEFEFRTTHRRGRQVARSLGDPNPIYLVVEND